jgi:hypothetical protein
MTATAAITALVQGTDYPLPKLGGTS